MTDPNFKGLPEQILELIKNRYNINSKGPYIVNIEKATSGNVESVDIGVSKLTSLLNRLTEISGFMNVAFNLKKKTGLNRFVLAFPSGETANEFVAKVWENKKFIMHGEIWVASVSHFKVTKKLILKGIDDPDMDISLLLENMRPPGNWTSHWESPIKIEKLRKRIPDPNAGDKFIYIETNATIATFFLIFLHTR